MTLASSIDVTKLLDSSDLVCSGTILAIDPLREMSGNYYGLEVPLISKAVQVKASNCYKGKLDHPTFVFLYDVPANAAVCQSNPCADFQPDSFVLVFLRRQENDWVPTTDYSNFQISLLTAGPASEGDAGERLEIDLVKGLADPDRRKVIVNVQLLGGLHRATSAQPLRQLLIHSDAETSGWVYLSLLKLGDLSELKQTAVFLKDPLSLRLGYLVTAITLAIKSLRDTGAAPALMVMATSPSQQVRYAAIDALRSIRDPESVPIFVQALKDPSQDIRYDAMMGLAEIVGKSADWTTSFDKFQESEQQYLKRWQDWWDAEGRKTYQLKKVAVPRGHNQAQNLWPCRLRLHDMPLTAA